MRIYEFAQLHNVSSKDLIEKLQKQGFDVKSHMSVLDDKAISFLNTSFATADKADKNVHKDEPLKEPKSPSTIENKVLQTSPVKTQKSSKTSGNRKQRFVPEKKEHPVKEQPKEVPAELVVHQMSVLDFADKTKKPVTDVIITLLKWGIMATKNQIIPESIVQRLASHYEISVIKAADKQEKEIHRHTTTSTALEKRPPVVVVVGHVDHGKTTLLDYIRKTRVALKEKGGITQHLGAYEATTSHGNIVFLDTPGHEAFVKIRQRGIRVADIVILIVAADDGVMPQTVEAIKYALSTKVPIVVAINKVDKADAARLDVIKRQLNQHGITVEDWGGDVICVPISAKTGQGVDRYLKC
jgi:translation initiation factor IF-2